MFTDPLSITYNSVAKTLPRISGRSSASVYGTADGEFRVNISESTSPKSGIRFVSFKLSRTLPDPTPADSFDPYRPIVNSFGLTYGFDDATRSQASVDHPLLRSAVLSFVDSTIYGRLIQGEK